MARTSLQVLSGMAITVVPSGDRDQGRTGNRPAVPSWDWGVGNSKHHKRTFNDSKQVNTVLQGLQKKRDRVGRGQNLFLSFSVP